MIKKIQPYWDVRIGRLKKQYHDKYKCNDDFRKWLDHPDMRKGFPVGFCLEFLALHKLGYLTKKDGSKKATILDSGVMKANG